MDDEGFRRFVLELAGPSRDRARLARLLGITEATAYGWINLSEQARFGLATSVRGDQNKLAKQLLIDAAAEIEKGLLQLSDVETYLGERLPAEPVRPDLPRDEDDADARRKASLKKGLAYAIDQLDKDDVPVERVIGAIEAVLAMNRGKL